MARAIEERIASQFRGKSERVIAKALGLSQPALNKLRNADGALGVHALLALRESLGMSIDRLLGFEDTPSTDAGVALIHRALEEYERQKTATPPTKVEAPTMPPLLPPAARTRRTGG